MVDPRNDRIELVESRHEAWRGAFERERRRLRELFERHGVADAIHRIDHVGSTAVPDLAAKDVVDVDVVVADDAVAPVSAAVADDLGGTRVQNHDGWHPVFRREHGQRFNDHVFAVSDDGWRVSVATRTVLRARPALRERYERRKRELAAATDDLERYSEEKSGIVRRLLSVARTDDAFQFSFSVPRFEDE